MVAVISGEALGLFNSIKTGVGSANFGQGRESIYVNASTGNLVLRQQDEFVAASGLDLSLLRTYNSQGQLDGDNIDGFRFNFSNQLTNLVGTPNQPGSQITRISGDGAETLYTYDASLQAYISPDGAGAHDQIVFDSGNNQWVWREGSSRTEEVYGNINGNWKLVARVDAEGRQVAFGHNSSGLVNSITDAAGQTLAITYTGTRVTAVTVSSDGATEQRLHYSYDTQGRLETVTVDLSPQDSSIADGNVYTTTYGYHDDSTRVASVQQSDGTLMLFYYTNVDGQGDYRISEVHTGRVNASGMAQEFDNSDRRITTYSYDLANRKTTITQISNPEAAVSGRVGIQTELTFDSAGRITEMEAPADQSGVRELTQYSYDADGNLLSLTDHSGDTTVYEYDSRGNQTLVRDAQGNTVEREYDSYNQLSKETVYLRPDPDGDGAEQPAEARVTHYVYDDQQRLRFVIGHDGTVQETRYSDAAQNAEYGIPARTVSAITYLQHGYFDQFDAANYSEASSGNPVDFTYASLNSWVQNTQGDIQANNLHNATRRSDTRLDFRGQVYSITSYSQVGSNGQGIADGSESTQYTVYDANGQLRSTIDPRGSGQDSSTYKASYVYDGLGRLLSSTDAEGHTSTTLYNDAQAQVISTDADGLQVTRSYATNGSLISEIRHDTTNGNATLGETRYFYDTLGRIRATQDAIGAISHSLYDDKGQMVAVISASGAITEFHYDTEGQQVQSTHYANRLSGSQLQSLLQKDNDGNVIGIEQSVTLADLRPTAVPGNDRSTYQYYDDAGQVRFFVDGEGYLSETQYNAQGQVLRTTQYGVKIQNPQGETTATLAANYAASNANLSVTSDSATQWVDPQQSYAQADSLGFNQRSIVNQSGSIDLSQSATTRPAQNPYVLSGTTNARVENTQIERVSGSAITTAYTRPPVQPYTYASTAIVAEQFTDTDSRTLSVASPLTSRNPQLEGDLSFSTVALQNIGGAQSQSKTVTVYREHTKVNSTNSSTKLISGAFTSRTAGPDHSSDKFHSWRLSVTVTRTDTSLPSGYDGIFSYSITSKTWDGSVDLTKYYGDNLPAGTYKITVKAEEKRETFRYINSNPGEPGGEIWIWESQGTYTKNTYSQIKTYNLGVRLVWTDPTYAQDKTTKFYYKSGSGSWISKSFSSSGHANTVRFDNPGSGTYSYRIDYYSGSEVMMRGENSFTAIATSNQSKSTVFRAQVKSVSGSTAVNKYSSAVNIKSIKAISKNQETGQTYTTWTYPQDISGDGFAWGGKVNLRIGSALPSGKYDVTLSITMADGSTSNDSFVYESGKQYFYNPTEVIWPASTQPDSAAVVFKYRVDGSNDNWTSVSPTVEGANHIADLGVIGDTGTKTTYEYLIEYIDGNQVVKSAGGTFVVDKDGKTTDSSSATANFKFASTKYVQVGTASSVSGYFSEGTAASVSRADIVVRDKVSGQVIYSGTDYPADYLAWLKAENPSNYTYNGNLNISADFVRHSFNTSQNINNKNWQIYDSTPAGATLNSVYDSTLKRNVIEISGDGTSNGFRTLQGGQIDAWNITDGTKARAELNLSGEAILYYRLETSKGPAYVSYSSGVQEPYINFSSSSNTTYYTFPLEDKYLDGNWHTFERDILADVAFLDPAAEVQQIKAFYIRGNGRIGTIEVDTHTPTGKGELGNGRYEVEVTTYDLHGKKAGTNTFDYEIGTQTEYHPTTFQWPESSRPAGSTAIFEYEASPNVWKSVPVLEDGANLKVILGDVDDGTIVEGNYNLRIRYEQNGIEVKKTTGNPSLTVGKGSTKASSFDFEYSVVSLQSGSGHAIQGYPVSIGSDPALNKIVAQVKNSSGQLVSTAETYPQLFGNYNGEVNLAIGSELAAGQAYSVTLALHYDDGSSVRAAFPVEVGEQPVQDRVIQWSESVYTPVAGEVTRLEYRRVVGDSNVVSYRFNDVDNVSSSNWQIYDNTPGGATATKVYDLQLQRDVIELSGSGIDNGFRLRNGTNGQFESWNITDGIMAKAEIQLSGEATVYYRLSTSSGVAFVAYRSSTSKPYTFTDSNGVIFYNFPLEEKYRDGSWQTFKRDIRADVAYFDTSIEIAEIDWFAVRGSGRIGTVEITNNDGWLSAGVNQSGSGFTANLGYELSGDYEYRIATYRDADGNGLSDNDRLLRTLSGTFAANDSGTKPASWAVPGYERSSAEGYAIEGYLSAAEAADIAYLETVVIDNATGSPISAQPVQTWIDPATLRDGSFAGRLNLLVGETLADGDYSVQVTRHYIGGSSQVDASFQQQVGRQLQSVTNPQLSLGLDEPYAASGVNLSIRPLGSSNWESLSLDPATGAVELDKASHPNGVYEYQLSYTLDVGGAPVSKSGVGRFTLAAGESYTQALSAAATGVDLADARIERSFYDDAGRVSATLDAEGYLTEYRYNRAGQLVSSTRYANRVADYDQSSHWLNSGTLQTLRPAADPAADRSSYWLYDGQGREVAEINAEGYVTEHKYDVAGNRVKSTQYATALGDLDSALTAVQGDPARLSLGGVDFVRHRFNSGDNIDASNWQLYDNDPTGASVTRAYDGQLQQDVVELAGSGTDNGFRLRISDNGGFTSWNITGGTIASAQIKLTGSVNLYYRVSTSSTSSAYVAYRSSISQPSTFIDSNGTTFYNFPLEDRYLDGNWQTFERDIQADIAYFDDSVELKEIDWFTVRGSGRIGGVEILTDTLEAAGTDIPGQLRPQASGADRISEWRYDGRNQVTHATDASGNTSTFTYTAGGQLASSRSGIIASGSILDNYLDNYQGDPTFSANDSEARDYQFEYDVQGRVIAERDHQGRVVLSHSYDDSGRRISSTDANGYTTHFAYRADGLLKYSLAPVFNPGNNALEWQLSSFSHNAFGEVTGTRQYASRLSNTALNNLGLAGDAATLDSLAASLVDGEDTVTSTVYTQRGQVDNSTDGEGFVSTSQYNAFGERTRLSRAIDVANSRQAVTDFSYSRRGELETSSAQLSSGPFASVGTNTVYNAFGEAVSSTDARGFSTDYAYDRLGQLVTQTNTLKQQTHLSYDAFGRVLTRTDALNRSTRYEYDDASRSQTVTTPEGVQTRTVNNIHGETFEVSIKVGDSWLRQVRYDYDTQGNLTGTTDALDNRARSEYNAAGQLTASVDASGVRTELTYDPQGRVLTRTQDVGGLNLTTTQRYGHRYEESVDASGSVTRTEYDKNGRVSRVIVDASSDGSGLNLLTQYRYDGQGNVLQVQEGSLSGGIDGSATIKRTTAYSYDELGRVLSETLDPNGLAITTRYEYDQAGNRTAITNALGHSTYFVYDELGRERFVLMPHSADGTWYTARERQYDAAGQLVVSTEHHGALRLPATLDIPSVAAIYNSITGWDRTTRYVYNDDGQLTHTIDALGYVTETVYNSSGRVSAVIRYADRIDPSSETVADLVRDSSKDRETRYQYDAAGRQTHTLRLFEQGGVQYAYVTESLYNSRGEVVGEIAYARALNLASETTAQLNAEAADNRHSTFIYDAAGRRTHTVDSLGHVTETRYDDSNDTETVIRYANGISVPAASSWTDLRATDLGISASSQHDQVIVTQFDAAGRKASLTEKVWADGALRDYVESYQYDALGNRTQISDPLGYKTYLSYDAAGRLTHKQVPANGTQGYLSTWSYDALGQVLSETHYSQAVAQNTDPSAINTNTLAHAQDRSSQYTYLSSGKLHTETDSAGVITEYTYTTFGEIWRTIEAKGLAEQRVTFRSFDQLGRLMEETSGLPDWEQSTIDNRHNLTEAELGADEQVATTRFGYNAFGELEKLVSPRGPGYISQQLHDQLGRKVGEIDARGGSTQTVLDAFGNIVATTDPNGNTGVFLYDANNQLTHQVTPDGAVTTYSYDAFGQAVDVRTYAQKLADSTDIAALNRAGLDALLSGLQDAVRDRHSVSVYDNRGQLLTSTQYGYDLINGHATANVTTYKYDAAGNRTAMIDARGARTDYLFDAQGRVTQETGHEYYATLTSHQTSTTLVRAITKYNYNAFDKTFEAEGYYWDVSAGEEKASVYGIQNRYMRYDHNGQLLTLLGPAFIGTTGNAQSSADFDGTIDTVPMRTVTERRYDALGRLVYEGQRGLQNASLNDDGSASGVQHGQIQASAYHYNRLDQQVYALDTDGGLTYNRHDAAGNLRSETRYDQRLTINGSPWDGSLNGLNLDSSVEHWRSDAQALQSSESSTGRTTHYQYNANNLVTKTESDAGVFFDLNNLVAPDSTSGDQQELQNGFSLGSTQGSQALYDANGNPIIQIDGKDQASFALYDAAGNRVLEVDRLGYVTEYIYDGLGQITAQTRYAGALDFAKLGAPADNEARHAWLDNLYGGNRAALVANVATGDERTTEYVYSGRGLLLEERTKGESFVRISNSGTALNVSRVSSDLVTRHDYDGNGWATTTVRYDGDENAADSRVESVDYNVYGQQVQTRGAEYTDYRGQSVRGTISYRYDLFGNRTAEIVHNDSGGQVTSHHYNMIGKRVETRDARENRGEANYEGKTRFYFDAFGNAVYQSKTQTDIDNAQSQVTTWLQYDALGREIARSNNVDKTEQGGLVQHDMAYNTHGQIIGKGINTDVRDSVIGGKYQEYYVYDELGRLFKTNADNGSPRIYLYDQNGNATLEITAINNNSLSGIQTARQAMNELTQSETQWKYSLYDQEDQLITVVDAPLATPTDNSDLDVNWDVDNDGSEVINAVDSKAGTNPSITSTGSSKKTTNSTSNSTVWVSLNNSNMPSTADAAVNNKHSMPAERVQKTVRDNNIGYVGNEGEGYASNPGGATAVDSSRSWEDNTDELFYLSSNDPRLNFEDLGLTAKQQTDLAGLLGSTSYQLDGTSQGSHKGYIERDTRHYYTSRQVTLDSGRTITVFTNRIEVEEQVHIFVPLSKGNTEYGWREVVITTNTYNYDITSDFLQADDSAADSALEDAQNNPLQVMPSLDWSVNGNTLSLDSSDVASVFGNNTKVKVLAKNASGQVVMNNTQYNWSDGMDIALNSNAAAVSLTFLSADGLVLHAVDLYSNSADSLSGSVGLPGEGVGLEHLPEVNKFWLSAGYQSSKQGSSRSTSLAYSDSAKINETTYAAVGGQGAISKPGSVDTKRITVEFTNAGTNVISRVVTGSEPGFIYYDYTYEQLVTIKVSGLPTNESVYLYINNKAVLIPGNGVHMLSGGEKTTSKVVNSNGGSPSLEYSTSVKLKSFGQEWGAQTIAHGRPGTTKTSDEYVRIFNLDSSAKTVEFTADGKTVTASVVNGMANVGTTGMSNSSSLAFTMKVKNSSGTVINEAKGNFNNTAPATVNNLTNAVKKTVTTNTYTRSVSSEGDSYTSVFYSQTGLYNREAIRNIALQLTGAANDETLIAHHASYNAFGENVASIDNNGNTTLYEYDQRGNVVKELKPEADVYTEQMTKFRAHTATEYGVNAFGEMVMEKVGAEAAAGASSATRSAVTNYNTQHEQVRLQDYEAGLLIASQDGEGDYDSQVYDQAGNLKGSSQLVYRANERGNGTSALYYQVAYHYDANNQLVRMNRFQDSSLAIDYGYSASGRYDEWDYDEFGNRIRHRNALYGDTNPVLYASFNSGGSVGSSGTVGQETYRYDGMGRVLQYKSYNGKITDYAYAWSDAVSRNVLAATGQQAQGAADQVQLGGYITAIAKSGMGGVVDTDWNQSSHEDVLSDAVDYFGKAVWHDDLGGHRIEYAYNYAGWLSRQTGNTALSGDGTWEARNNQDIRYTYYHNGNLFRTYDYGNNGLADGDQTAANSDIAPAVTEYRYDKAGNRTGELYYRSNDLYNNLGRVVYQHSNAVYDEQGRITSIEGYDEYGNAYQIDYTFDAFSNRRSVSSVYDGRYVDNLDGTIDGKTQSFYYTYDKNNRFTLTLGEFENGQIVLGKTGTAITYNGLDQRYLASRASDGSIREKYAYDSNGRLTTVHIDQGSGFVLRASRVNNDAGQVTAYYEYDSAGKLSSATDNYYNADGIQLGYATTQYDENGLATDEVIRSRNTFLGDGQTVDTNITSAYPEDGAAPTVTTLYNSYEKWDSYKTKSVVISADNKDLHPKQRDSWENGEAFYTYDSNGHIRRVYDVEGQRAIAYVTDKEGRTLVREEINDDGQNSYGREMRHFYYFNGHAVGDVGNDQVPSRYDYVKALAQAEGAGNRHSHSNGDHVQAVQSADFDQNYQPINPNYPTASYSSFEAQGGETLQSIAAMVWGDSSLWYLLADANGMKGDEVLTKGQRLELPNVVTNIHNNSDTFRPVDGALQMGDTAPTLPDVPPPPPVDNDGGCGALGMILVIVVAVVATVLTAGAFAAAAGASIGGMMTAGASAIATGSLGFGAAFVAGAAGSIASQVTAMGLGMQEDFSWSDVAIGGFTTMATVGAAGYLNGIDSFTKVVDGVSKLNWAGSALLGASNVVSSYGINKAFNKDVSFSWRNVATSAVTSGVASGLTEGFSQTSESGVLGGVLQAGGSIGADVGRELTSALINESVQSAIWGDSFDWGGVAIATAAGVAQSSIKRLGGDGEPVAGGGLDAGSVTSNEKTSTGEQRLTEQFSSSTSNITSSWSGQELVVTASQSGIWGSEKDYWSNSSVIQRNTQVMMHSAGFNSRLDAKLANYEARTIQARAGVQAVWDDFHAGVAASAANTHFASVGGTDFSEQVASFNSYSTWREGEIARFNSEWAGANGGIRMLGELSAAVWGAYESFGRTVEYGFGLTGALGSDIQSANWESFTDGLVVAGKLTAGVALQRYAPEHEYAQFARETLVNGAVTYKDSVVATYERSGLAGAIGKVGGDIVGGAVVSIITGSGSVSSVRHVSLAGGQMLENALTRTSGGRMAAQWGAVGDLETNPLRAGGVPNLRSAYSGSVYDSGFVGPVDWVTFYRGEGTPNTQFLSSLAQEKGIGASRASFLDAKANGTLDNLFDTHGNVGSQGLPTIGVTKDPVVAEYFAKGPNGKNLEPTVTEFRMQRHEFDAQAMRNYENRRDVFDINLNIGRQEQEFLFNTEIPSEALVRQWLVK